MSKRLNKRQLRELEELEALKAAEQSATPQEDSEEEEEEAAPSNPFAALEGNEEPEDEEEEEEAAPAAKKKTRKKKPKKKKPAALDGDTPSPAVSTPKKGKKGREETPAPDLDGLDEVDRALAELKLKYGDAPEPQAGANSEPSAPRSALAFRNLLSVDPKNLDADAELRRFFGSKVIASATPTQGHGRRGVPNKARYTLAKPKPQYPPPTSLAGLNMKELDDDAVADLYDRRGWEQTDDGEKWFTFTHSPAWRGIERQFLGAVASHDPNALMALLQVYPWHVDTLLQMSEVYRLQSDIGAASDFAERALYAFDRCLIPGFNVQSGACRLDFDYVENRPMFTGLHRIISYLGRRGCWVTAFNFGKLLFALDPEGDPHCAALWLDFLAVKSGNGKWLLDMLDMREHSRAAALWHGYPGMAYAKALALRADEDVRKDKAHEESTAALVSALKTFPEVIILLADKLGASVPSGARTSPLLAMEAGYSSSPTIVIHLLAHIYVSRSEALWKEPGVMAWFESTLAKAYPSLDDGAARAARAEAHAIATTPRDLDADGELTIPLNICRHVVCSESTSWVGFLPPPIAKRPVHAYDPLPPSTAESTYDAAYFNPVARAGARLRDMGMGGGGGEDYFDRFLATIRGMAQRPVGEWREPLPDMFREFAGVDPTEVGDEERTRMVNEFVHNWEMIVQALRRGEIDLGDYGAGMPGAFPQ